MTIGDIALDPATRTVIKDDTPVDLTTVEFELLHPLLSAAGRVVSREDISQRVLGRAFDPFDRSIDVHIGRVPRKFADDAADGERHQDRSRRRVNLCAASPLRSSSASGSHRS